MPVTKPTIPSKFEIIVFPSRVTPLRKVVASFADVRTRKSRFFREQMIFQ